MNCLIIYKLFKKCFPPIVLSDKKNDKRLINRLLDAFVDDEEISNAPIAGQNKGRPKKEDEIPIDPDYAYLSFYRKLNLELVSLDF